ncbi:MAG: hypothetical protein GXC76_09535 [Rhodanobacteraceae bacterium]|jgi:hypothetical protein|nr:hypothetical protein [Rhodanobacteraceae bacterium]
MKTTRYFLATRIRPDRAMIRDEWIERAIRSPVREHVQADGRIRRWASIDEAEGRYLRVVLLDDGETVHNAFFDRDFTP